MQLLGEATQIRFATRDEFFMWHEGLSANELPDPTMPDIGKVLHNIFHVYNDAHAVCVWAAHNRQPIIDKLLLAIGGDR